MFRVIQLYILILVCCFALMRTQHQQQTGNQFQPSWLYSMPWRPLILPTANPLPPMAGIAQLSPGYTGPQTFPPVPQDQQQFNIPQQQLRALALQQYPQPYQPVLVGLFTPQLQPLPLAAPPPAGHFGLPFRSSPFAGYTDDENSDTVQEQEHHVQRQQQQLEEPPFHAHPHNKPIAERSDKSRSAGGFGGEKVEGAGGGVPLSYVYLSPSNVYNLVRT
ncbi:uncharacterized protein [Drosophila takahashii]|uniref:uncharacterized protein n=1 Tax=Drosophila takahashii TaxID=29030 RepID=UPI0007E5F0AF